MSTKWIETKPFEMEDEVKKLKKTSNIDINSKGCSF
jgi:hypothetical protein